MEQEHPSDSDTAVERANKKGKSLAVLFPFLQYLRHRVGAQMSSWDALKKRVAKEEWMKMRAEVDQLFSISAAVDSLPGLRHMDMARVESECVIIEWRKLDLLMKKL